MSYYRSSTQTAAVNNANALTITSPNNKTIFLKQYVVACTGTDGPAATMTIQITDEDSNVLWEDAILIGVTNEHSGPFRVDHTFPGRGLQITPKKNAIVTAGNGGAATGSEVSVLWSI
jgi:hypothetical protein